MVKKLVKNNRGLRTGQKYLEDDSYPGPKIFNRCSPVSRPAWPEGWAQTRIIFEEEDTATIPVPGTPFRLTAEGRLLVAVDLQELLTNQGIPQTLARRLLAQKDPEAVAKVLLNAFYLQGQGKLQNAPGYIRAGIEDGYDLLPQVASRLEGRRRELEARLRSMASQAREAGKPMSKRLSKPRWHTC